MNVIVLGAGLQGIATALDLAWNKKIGEITLGDYELERAQKVAKLCNDKYGNRVTPVQCDVNVQSSDNEYKGEKFDALVELIKPFDVCINVTNYYFNVGVMKACLSAKTHYMDLGGLYVKAKEQLALNNDFEEAGLIGITGIGGCAGVTNISSAWAVEQMDTVEEIHFYCGCNDWSTTTKPFEVSYAIETIMDEFRMNPIQFVDGAYKELKPHANEKIVAFSEPVGSQLVHNITHSELGTVPVSFKDKGLKQCTYSIGFPQELSDSLEFLHKLGFSSREDTEIDGAVVKPVKVLKKLMDAMPDDPNAVINDCDVIKTVVTGYKNGEKVEYTLESVCRPVKWWPELMGAQVYIGGASAWTTELIRRDVVTLTGVHGPELAVPAEAFFEEAAKREIYVEVTKKFLVGSNDWDAVARKKKINQWD